VKSLLAAVLVFEAVVVALAIPVAVLADGRGAAAAWALAGLAVLLVLGAGVVRRRGGIAVGWVLQALVCLSGLLVPAMGLLGLVFLGVWVVALVYGAKGDRLAAENRATAADPRREEGVPAPGGSSDEGSVTPEPSGDVAGPPAADG
jgi:hypothetical protein